MEPIGDPSEAPDSDFAEEHASTTVDDDVTAGEEDGEQESPKGWDGLSRETPP